MATATTTVDPWLPLQPYLQRGFQGAQNLYNQGGPSYFPGSTVAQYGADTNSALGMVRDQAMQGSPVAGAAGQQVTDTLQGDYLNSNPYLDAMYNNAARGVTRNYSEAVAPSIAANFGLGGRTGSNMAFANTMDSSRDALAQNLSGMAANMYGENYENERGRQMQASQLAPQTAQLGYYDASQLLNVGQQYDTQAQNNINDQFNRYQFEQERPYDNLGRYMGYLGGNYGSRTTEPSYNNDLARNLGLAGAGIGAAQELGLFDFLSGIFTG